MKKIQVSLNFIIWHVDKQLIPHPCEHEVRASILGAALLVEQVKDGLCWL